ncbi:MAG: dihydrofolate reductase family protein [Anaerolineales bacterium]|nr:dihydrofolate reductase family protein [Anaerolineales bacterium]
MAKLKYMMLMSMDGFIEDAQGDFSWCAPDAQVHTYVNKISSSIGTHIYGRRMYDIMRYWENAHEIPEQPAHTLEWALQWQAADKIVYSRTLTEVQTARTRLESEFDLEALRQFKADASQDISISGPELAAHVLRAGLVDEITMVMGPVIIGNGKRFLPAGLRLDLDLLDMQHFDSGFVALHYAVRH